MKLKKKLSIILLSIVLVGCSKEGPMGPTGPAGPAGPIGNPGAPGVGITADITSDTTWSPANNPYEVRNTIIIKQGITLTIQPGCIIKKAADVIIYVDGTLNAQGEAANHIQIGNIGNYGFGVIIFTDTSVGSVMRYCQLQDCTLRYETSTPDVQFCKISFSKYLSGGYAIEMGCSGVTVANCTLEENIDAVGGTGIYVKNVSGASVTTVNNCIIRGFKYAGVNMSNNGTSLAINISNSSLIDNVRGIYINGPTPVVAVTNSNLYGGTRTYENPSANNQTATGNWWGTTDTAAIDSSIIDFNDNPSYGTVDYSGYLSSAVTVNGCGW